jgi:hypothetical protein
MTSLESWLLSVVGKKLDKVLAQVFNYKSNSSELFSLHALSLEFNGIDSGRIFCGIDGSTLCWDTKRLEIFKMNNYGEEKVFDLSNTDEIWINLVGRKLIKVYLINSEIENGIFAVQLIFDGSLEVFIANLGDELVFDRQLSKEIIDEEKAKFIAIS